MKTILWNYVKKSSTKDIIKIAIENFIVFVILCNFAYEAIIVFLQHQPYMNKIFLSFLDILLNVSCVFFLALKYCVITVNYII